MALRSLHRLSPLAQRFLCVEISADFCLFVSLRDVLPLPLALFPVYRFFCAASTKAELRSYRLSESIVTGGSTTTQIILETCKAVIEARGFKPKFSMRTGVTEEPLVIHPVILLLV
jgi:hypothetical protein